MSISCDNSLERLTKKQTYQIDPCKGCMEKLKKMEIPDINFLNNCCYDMTARASGAQSINQIRGTKLVNNSADCIHKAMHNMGRSPCNFKLSSPPIFIPTTPNLFQDLENGLTPDEALNVCLSKCYPNNTCGAPNMSCIDDCLLQRSCIVESEEPREAPDQTESIYDPKFNLPLTAPQNFFPPTVDYKSPTCGVEVETKENYEPAPGNSPVPKCNAPKNVNLCECGGQTFLGDDGCPLVQCFDCGEGTPLPKHCPKLDKGIEDCECGGTITKDKTGCPLLNCNDCDILRSGPKQFMVAHPVSFTIGVIITVVLTGLVFVCALYVIFRRVKKDK